MEDNAKINKLSYCGNIIIALGLLGTISILGYQFFHWLKNGEWLPLPFYKLLQYLGFSFEGILDLPWQGLQKAIFWILEQPLAGIIGVTSLAIGWLMSLKD